MHSPLLMPLIDIDWREKKIMFVKGMELSEMFFKEAVEPILDEVSGQLRYSAGLLGPGSEVLGFDNEISSDHHWGPRVMLFLEAGEVEQFGGTLKTVLSHKLPRRYKGYPTSFTPPGGDSGNAVVQMLDYENQGQGMINHRVEIFSFDGFLEKYLGFSLKEPFTESQWLSLPQQHLRSLRAGRLFRDDLGLGERLAEVNYYPRDIWLYLLASTWSRIEQTEHLMGRAGHVGDEIGSSLIAASIVKDLMRLVFLMEREYCPYAKWFGTAFNQLKGAMLLKPHLESALASQSWEDRERCLVKAYGIVAEMHNRLGITEALPEEPRSFHGRPYKVISLGEFSRAIKGAIEDPAVARLCHGRLYGNIDLVTDSTDVVESLSARAALRHIYD